MSESRVEYPVKVFFFALASTAIFAAMNVVAKIAAENSTIAQVVFFRNIMAFFPVLLMIRMQGGWGLLKTVDHLGHFWRGFIGIVSMGCFFASFAMLPMANATAIHFASPLILTMLSVPMLGEKVGRHRWGAVMVGLAAVLFMVGPARAEGAFAGSMVAFAAAILAAFAMIFIRKLGRTEHALTIVFYFTIYGTVIGGLAMIFMWEPLTLATFLMLAAVGVMGGVGQVCLTYAYAHAPAAYVAPFSYLSMIFAVIADILVWGTWPDWHIYAGSCVIIASGLYLVYREALANKRFTLRTNIYSLQPVKPTEEDVREGDRKSG